MLKLALKPGDSIRIGDNIIVQLDEHCNANAHLKVDAPKDMNIKRQKRELLVNKDRVQVRR